MRRVNFDEYIDLMEFMVEYSFHCPKISMDFLNNRYSRDICRSRKKKF